MYIKECREMFSFDTERFVHGVWKVGVQFMTHQDPQGISELQPSSNS